MNRVPFVLIAGVLLTLGGCGTGHVESGEGREGGPCYPNGTCDTPLECDAGGICVPARDPCREVTCSGHGTCVATGNQPSCDCDGGYHAQGLDCVLDTNPCAGVTCSGHGTCVLEGGQARCECDDGYQVRELSCIKAELDLTDPLNAGKLRTLGFVNVVAFGADPAGQRDSTAAIQAAIDEGYKNHLAVLFPLGTYVISDTLRNYKWWENTFPKLTHVLIGENRDGRRPLIKLAANAPRFDVAGSPRPMIAYALYQGSSDWTDPDEPPPIPSNLTFNPITGPESWVSAPMNLFDDQLRGIDFDLAGHPGAVGVYFPAAQKALMADITIRANGAHTGVWGTPGRNMGAVNLEVNGGQTGIRTTSVLAGTTLVGLRLLDQTGAAIINSDFCPLTVVGFSIRNRSESAIENPSYSTASGSMELIDGVIEMIGTGKAINNTAGRSIYLRNVYGNGPRTFMTSKTGQKVEGSGAWFRVAEYAYSDQHPAGGEYFKVYNLLGGAVNQVPEPVKVVQNAVSIPPDLVALHNRLAIPQVTFSDISKTHVVTEAPYNAVPDNNTKDSQLAIQKAIDDAESDGRPVFIPKGTFYISQPLVLKSNTQLIGIGPKRNANGGNFAVITNLASWNVTGPGNSLIRTIDDKDAKPFLGFLLLQITAAVDRPLEWSAGRDSTIAALGFRGAAPDETIHISKNGGGRMYLFEPKTTGTAANHRSIRIVGTTEPISWYGCNVEDQKGVAANIEISGARNIRIYGIKREGRSPTLILNNSFNVGLFGLGTMREGIEVGSGGYLQIKGNSDQILIAHALVQKAYGAPNGEPLIKESLAAKPVVSIIWPDSLSLYSRGELDDEAMK